MNEIEKKFQKDLGPSSLGTDQLIDRLERVCKGLVYISEIDSPVTVFAERADEVNGHAGMISEMVGDSAESVREVDFGSFFDRLTAARDWHGEREHERTKKFLDLRKLIEENLTEPKVFRIGETHVRIVVAGLDANGCAVGVTIRALET
jgi:hypothetical protein